MIRDVGGPAPREELRRGPGARVPCLGREATRDPAVAAAAADVARRAGLRLRHGIARRRRAALPLRGHLVHVARGNRDGAHPGRRLPGSPRSFFSEAFLWIDADASTRTTRPSEARRCCSWATSTATLSGRASGSRIRPRRSMCPTRAASWRPCFLSVASLRDLPEEIRMAMLQHIARTDVRRSESPRASSRIR